MKNSKARMVALVGGAVLTLNLCIPVLSNAQTPYQRKR